MNANKYIASLLLIALAISLNILCSFINWDIDLTADKRHSLAKETTSVIKELDDNLFIKVYLEGDFPAEFKKLQKVTESLLKK